MNRIRSKYIVTYICSFIKECILFPIISKNKEIINKLELKPKDFSKASKSYLKIEKGISRIYNKSLNSLTFEGKYEKGNKILGKEYILNKLCFNGEYKNNKKYKGEILNKQGNIIFKGEFKDGLPWNGKFYDSNNWQSSGELINGCGIVKEYNFEGNLYFKGEYKEGKYYSGIEYNINRNKIYEGQYKNNLRWRGYYYSKDQKTKTYIENGNGPVVEYDINCKLVFQGEYKNGKRFKGKGKEYYKENNKLKYSGSYKNGLYDEGIYYNIKGYKEFEGKFIIGNKLEGILYEEKNEIINSLFYGKFKEDKKYYGIQLEGFIEEFDDDGMCGFIGEFYKNDNYYQGKYYIGNFKFNEKKENFIQDKLKEINISELENNYIFKYEGEFKKGKFYKGKEYIDNQLLFEGEYKQGKYWNGKMYKIKNKSMNKMEGFEGIYENGYKKGEEILYKEKGNVVVKKIFYDKNNYDYIYCKDDEIISTKIVDGNCDNVIECFTIRENDEIIIDGLYNGKYKKNERYIGQECYSNGNLKFEGEYKDGKYYYGIEYYFNNSKEIKKFEGEFKDGKYYKGKEYYNDIDNPIKFEGLYKEGKRYLGWYYNRDGGLKFVGEYNLGLFWNGYFYDYKNLENQKETGNIINGNGSNIIYYNSNICKLKGQFKKGKIYNGEGKFKEKTNIKLNYININEIDIKISYYGIFKNGEFIEGKIDYYYTINKKFNYEKRFDGILKDGKYYKGWEYICYKKRKEESSAYVKLRRYYDKGIIIKSVSHDKNEKKVITDFIHFWRSSKYYTNFV